MIEKRILEKRVLIDYLSVSMDFIDIYRVSKNIFQVDTNDLKFLHVLKLLGYDGNLSEIPRCQPVRGYKEAYVIGEHIKLLFGGEHTKNSNDRYSMNLLMSGQACREFENFLDGNWTKLLSYLIENNAKIKRLDIAIDDFDGEQIDIYDIEPILRNNHFISPFRKINYQFTEYYTGDSVVSEGYTITLGSAGSNQLQIYDKRLERNAKDEPDLDTDIWYRYEMRFVNEKADAVANIYVTSIEENNSLLFMRYARELLLNCLDLKTYNSKNSQKTRWKTDSRWTAFLKSVEKIDLNVKHRVSTTIEKRKVWYDRSLKKVNAAFYAGFDGNESFFSYVIKNIQSGFDSFKEQDLAMINNYRKNKGLKTLDRKDILNIQNNLKEFLGDENE